MRLPAYSGALVAAAVLAVPAWALGADERDEKPLRGPAKPAAVRSERPKLDLEKLYRYDTLRGASQPKQAYVRPLAFGSFGYYGGFYGAPYAGYPYYGYYYSASGPYLFRDYARFYSGYFPGYDGYSGRGYYYDPGPVRWRSNGGAGGQAQR